MTNDNLVQLSPPINGMVPTSAHLAIHATLKRALAFGEDGMTVIMGIAGIGKTKTVKAFAAGKPNVAVCTLSGMASGKQSGLIRICNALGEQVHAKGVNLEDTLARRLHTLRLSDEDHRALLIIDEAQHATIQLLEGVRFFWDQVGLGIALVGNQQLSAVVNDLEENHPQLRSRIRYCLPLDSLKDRDLELFCKSYNATPAAVERVHELAKLGGAFRTVKNLLSIAGEIRGEHAGRIDTAHVQQAAVQMNLIKPDARSRPGSNR